MPFIGRYVLWTYSVNVSRRREEESLDRFARRELQNVEGTLNVGEKGLCGVPVAEGGSADRGQMNDVVAVDAYPFELREIRDVSLDEVELRLDRIQVSIVQRVLQVDSDYLCASIQE